MKIQKNTASGYLQTLFILSTLISQTRSNNETTIGIVNNTYGFFPSNSTHSVNASMPETTTESALRVAVKETLPDVINIVSIIFITLCVCGAGVALYNRLIPRQEQLNDIESSDSESLHSAMSDSSSSTEIDSENQTDNRLAEFRV